MKQKINKKRKSAKKTRLNKFRNTKKMSGGGGRVREFISEKIIKPIRNKLTEIKQKFTAEKVPVAMMGDYVRRPSNPKATKNFEGARSFVERAPRASQEHTYGIYVPTTKKFEARAVERATGASINSVKGDRTVDPYEQSVFEIRDRERKEAAQKNRNDARKLGYNSQISRTAAPRTYELRESHKSNQYQEADPYGYAKV
jgi:hypothetical protein